MDNDPLHKDRLVTKWLIDTKSVFGVVITKLNRSRKGGPET